MWIISLKVLLLLLIFLRMSDIIFKHIVTLFIILNHALYFVNF